MDTRYKYTIRHSGSELGYDNGQLPRNKPQSVALRGVSMLREAIHFREGFHTWDPRGERLLSSS